MGQVSSVGTPAARVPAGVERAAERRGVEAERAAEQAPIRRGEDRVELSRSRTAPAGVPQESSVRSELIARVRDEIASGTYETDARIDGAINALLSGSVLDTIV